jgi:lysophospholipase L1-like esterase
LGEEVPAKNRDSFRILGIGDSITDGTYLPEDKRYLFIIKDTLRANTKKRIEVVNAAVGGYNTWQEAELIKEKGLLTKPDLIIVGVCLNDYIMNKPNLKQSYFNRLSDNLNDGSRARYFDFLYQKSAFYKFIYDFLSNIRRGIGGEQGYSRYLKEYNFEISPSDFYRWKEPFADMIDIAKKNNAKILFVIFPLHNQIIKNEDVSCKPLSDFLKTKGAYFLDLAKDFNNYTKQGKTLFVRRDIIHPNADGQMLAARAITDYILENKILE